jgi:vacuolar-type H+-ATPase subunit E/Vma4
MKVLELLDQLEDLIESSSSLPLFGKTVINRDEVLAILKDVRVIMPDEVKQAKWIKDERGKILNDAQQESERILRSAQSEANVIVAEAQDRVEKLVQKDEIVKLAKVKGQEIIDNAKAQSTEIKSGAYKYADQIMGQIELNLEKHIDSVKRNRMELERYQEKI